MNNIELQDKIVILAKENSLFAFLGVLVIKYSFECNENICINLKKDNLEKIIDKYDISRASVYRKVGILIKKGYLSNYAKGIYCIDSEVYNLNNKKE